MNVSPSSGAVGDTLVITGSGFGAERGDSRICFGEVTATEYFRWTDTRIEVKIPPGVAGQVEITVVTPGGTSNAVVFVVENPDGNSAETGETTPILP